MPVNTFPSRRPLKPVPLLHAFLTFLLPCFCVLWVATSCVSPISYQPDGADVLMHRRLIWTDSPQSRAVVCWDTVTGGDDHRVYYDAAPRNGVVRNYSHVQLCTTNGAYTVSRSSAADTNDTDEPELYFHHAQLSGLKPGTTYSFVLVSGRMVSKEFHFRTAPAGDEPLKIIFGGDSRTGVEDRQNMNRLIAQLAGKDESIIAFAHGGDYVGSGMNFRQWQSWLADHELTTTASGRMLPLIPARGNHEASGPLYDQIMAFPGGEGMNYYATWLSPEILFVTLNTETETAGAQKDFLEASLAEGDTARWRVAQYHRPLYPAVKEPPNAKEHWVPLFEKHNLALACEADGHCIKRTVPIRDGKQDPTGVVYIGEGGLGVGQRTPKTDRWYVQEPGMVDKGHHVQLLSFTENRLSIDVIGINGNVIDSSAITK